MKRLNGIVGWLGSCYWEHGIALILITLLALTKQPSGLGFIPYALFIIPLSIWRFGWALLAVILVLAFCAYLIYLGVSPSTTDYVNMHIGSLLKGSLIGLMVGLSAKCFIMKRMG